jgi:hypothetical protein
LERGARSSATAGNPEGGARKHAVAEEEALPLGIERCQVLRDAMAQVLRDQARGEQGLGHAAARDWIDIAGCVTVQEEAWKESNAGHQIPGGGAGGMADGFDIGEHAVQGGMVSDSLSHHFTCSAAEPAGVRENRN